MALKFTKEQVDIFSTCSLSSLSPEVTHMVYLAAQLAGGQHLAAQFTFQRGQAIGLSSEQLNRCACLASCVAGPRVEEGYINAQRGRIAETTALFPNVPITVDLSASSFKAFNLCSTKSLETKSTHLVALGACLAAGCACASYHITEARKAGATESELARTACIAACACGLRNKWTYVEMLQTLERG